MNSESNSHSKATDLKELAMVFFRLGAIAFGGPAAHIAMMDEEIVQKRKWITRERLLDLLGVTNLIPGPNSTELAINIGFDRGGWKGLIVAGSAFIFPAMVIVWILAYIYVQYQALPQAQWLLYGIKPVIVAIILQALWKLGKKAVKDNVTKVTGILAVVAFFFNINEILILLIVGLGVMVYKERHRFNFRNAWVAPMTISPFLAQTNVSESVTSPSGWGVFLFFLKVGFFLYGSGYVLLAFLQNQLVEQNQWLTSEQLIDAIAIGQFTPGPILTTATFIGYLLAGNMGAVAATVGIFLPSFLVVLIINPWVDKLRNSPLTASLLDGVNVASLGLMAGVTYILGTEAIVDGITVTMAITATFLVFRYKFNSLWLILAGALIGLVVNLL
ncbi:chromate transporter [Cyanobacterium stanieri LEGE 03274]|uniref:Chromate transporter n=1 Tax=Cyanobacterium stanieri LEGE 03274 TaxID=1828756 RepID=A0ABR9V4U1_9CHRO|nr:chromate transporter [Cyanobacterium stanieri]MBE9222171.1 chromate transporter [Cyanobacterium stanieri LEGE 03274]